MKPLLALFLFVACTCQAQTSSITLSKKFTLKDPGLMHGNSSIFKVGENWYTFDVDFRNMQFAYTATLNKLKYAVSIIKYDADMKELKKSNFQSKEKDLGPFTPKMTYFHGQLVLLYYRVMEDNGIKLFLSTIDPETLEEKENKELYTFSERNVGFLKAEKVITRNTLVLMYTPDSTKLFIAQAGNTDELFTCFVGEDMVPVKKTTTKLKDIAKDMDINAWAVDNKGNKFFAYSYKAGPSQQRALLLVNEKGKDSYLALPAARGEAFEAGPLAFQQSRDNTRMYVYAAYGHGDEDEAGLMVTTIDAERASVAKPLLYPFLPDVLAKLKKRDYAGKWHKHLFMEEHLYEATEMEDGTLVLTGYPMNRETPPMSMSSTTSGISHSSVVIRSFSGPVINAFIKDGKCNFGVLYRNQVFSQVSGVIVHPYGNKIVCIYTDSKKNLDSRPSDDLEKVVDDDDLILAEAVLGSDGSVLSRKMIGERAGKLDYFPIYASPLSGHSYIFPLGRNRVNLSRFYTEIEQWATLDIN